MKTPIKISLYFVLFVVVTGTLAGIMMFNKKHTDMAKAKPQFVIAASALEKEFEDNETAASPKYTNKIIEVSGIVSSIKQAENSSVTITLSTGSDMSSVICTFTSLAESSKPGEGDTVTLRGECSGFLMDVLLNNCALVK